VLNTPKQDLPRIPLAAAAPVSAPVPVVPVSLAPHKNVAVVPESKAPASRNWAQYDKLARERLENENFEEALALLDQALQLNAKSAKTFNARGYAHLRLRNYQPAIADFTDAIRLNPSYANAYHNRAVARRAVGQAQEAKADDREADKLLNATPLTASR
jgi:tetratricopeptide (TPR) repeat protein